jgi:PHS family inorganic phosphate transporter-like MFS transporter
MLTGIGSTLLLPETKQRTLEEISNENQDGFIEGVAGHPDKGLIAPTLAHDQK